MTSEPENFSFSNHTHRFRFRIKSQTIVISASKTKKNHLVHLLILNLYTVIMSKKVTSRTTVKKNMLCANIVIQYYSYGCAALL